MHTVTFLLSDVPMCLSVNVTQNSLNGKHLEKTGKEHRMSRAKLVGAVVVISERRKWPYPYRNIIISIPPPPKKKC